MLLLKDVRSEIKLYSYYFSNNVSNEINVTGILYSRHTSSELNKEMFNQNFCHRNNDIPRILLGSMSEMGVCKQKHIVMQWP